jgi:hypothetical protein
MKKKNDDDHVVLDNNKMYSGVPHHAEICFKEDILTIVS